MDLEDVIRRFKIGEVENIPADELLEYTQQLENFFSAIPDPSKLDSYLGITFPDSQTEGLIAFLRQNITVKRYDKVKEHVFNLMQFIIVQKTWRADVTRFHLNFKEVANLYWKQGKEPARIQQAALDCLISLFENFGHSLDATEFEVAPLYWELLPRSEKSSFQPTVRAKMFHLMGILAALGTDSFMKEEPPFKQLFMHMTSTVKSQVESTDAHLEVSILHGCMKGMNWLLTKFGSRIGPEDPALIAFQEHLEQIVDPSCSIAKEIGKAKIKRREFQRAALELVADHSELLKERLYSRYKQWFEDLVLWAKSPNGDDNKVGRKAMNRFLDTIVRYAREFLEGNEVDANKMAHLNALFKFFAERFKNVLGAKDANKAELIIAVRGFGMLSTLSGDRKKSLEMLELMMEQINSIIQELDSSKVDKYSGILSVLPTYLESVASMLSSFRSDNDSSTFTELHFESLKKLTVALIRFYPELTDNQRSYCHISVQKLFDSLWLNHHSLCEPFIEAVYHHSFLHLVSCPTRAEIDILVETWKRNNPDSKKSAWSQLGLRSITSYVRFWRLLLSRGASDCDELKLDLLMKLLLTSINKLDLKIEFESEKELPDGSQLDPFQGATANNSKDFQIFVNIVDFFQNLMGTETALHRKFEKWIPIFFDEMLVSIKSNPFVSGFYKILSVIFDTARSVKYFDQEHEGRQELQKRLNVFIRNLSTKIREYRDDLLFAVLELWLSLPDALIMSNFTALNQTLQTVFITGRNSFPLAVKGLEAIERWLFQPEFPVEEIKIIMNSIYPILQTYFIHSESSNEPNVQQRKSGTRKGSLKEMIKKNVQSLKRYEDPTLKGTQVKILDLLGSFGEYLDLETQQCSGLSKDDRFLEYNVPFVDVKPQFFIDDLLPRVLELCENSVERQTRVSACEFFHTICLIFIGKSRERSQERLCKLIFTAMLKLGCDSDITVRQLFNPLCLQAIHWFTKRDSIYAPVVLACLTEALAQHDDLSLRELGALCTGEYFSWSLKHQGSKSDPGKDVLNNILAMSTHASPDYRQGAVLAFNSAYRDFREQDKLVNEFTFNLIYSFLTSLKLSKDLPEDSLLIRNTKQSIQHLEKIVKKKRAFFNTALRERRFRPTMGDRTRNPKLQDIVDWMLEQGGHEASVYREECLRLTRVFSDWVNEYKTTEQCLRHHESAKGIDGLISIAEQSLKTGLTDSISFLEGASSFYGFLYEYGMLKRTIFDSSGRSKFVEHLVAMCKRALSEVNGLSDEDKVRMLGVFCQLKFSREIFDDNDTIELWFCALQLSKAVENLVEEATLRSLAQVINFGEVSESMKIRCRPLLTFDPSQQWNSVSDRASSLPSSTAWYRIMAEEGLLARMVPENELVELREQLWMSIGLGLFFQLESSSGTAWEAHDLNLKEVKILENYLVIALSLGLDHETVINAIFDPTTVTYKEGSFQLSTSKGRIYRKHLISGLVYCDGIFKFTALLEERAIAEVGALILRLLELLKTERSLRSRFKTKIFQETLSSWRMISNNCDLQTTLKIFAGLIVADVEGCRNSTELSDWWNGPNLLQAAHLDLMQKASVFGYIIVFAQSRNKKISEAVIKTVSTLVNQDLRPSQTSWTEVGLSVSHFLRKVLKTLELIPNQFALLEPILSMVQKISQWNGNSDLTYSRVAKEALEKVVKVQVADVDRVEMAFRMYEIITSPGESHRKFVESEQVWKSCLLPVVSSLNLNASKLFFKKNIHDLISQMKIKATSHYEHQLKILAVSLLELMIYQTNSEFIKGKDLSDAFWKKASPEEIAEAEAKKDQIKDHKERMVYRSIVRVCLDGVINTPIPAEGDQFRGAVLAFNNSCYNTLVAQLLITKAEENFCDRFLFPGRKIFENIVDASVAYEFPVVIDEDLHKAGVVSYRKKLLPASDSLNSTFDLHRLHSPILSGSSLEPEATNYDFTTSVMVENSEFYQRIYGETTTAANDIAFGTAVGDNVTEDIKLEWNEINEHPCMYSYVQALKLMGEFQRLNKDGKIKWAKNLSSTLKEPSVHKSIKTFIVGGIINTPESLEACAEDLVEPITKLIITDCFGTVKMNHFVQDILLTLLSWYNITKAKPTEDTVKMLIEYIVLSLRNEAISSRKDLTSYVLEILQNVVRCWVKDVTVIPSQKIISLGDVNNPTEERSMMMILVFTRILQGGQLPQREAGETMKILKKACNSRFKGVYTTAAKCIGLLLKRMKAEAPPDITEQNILAVTQKLINAKAKPSKFIDLVISIHKNFPDIMNHIREVVFELCQQQKIRPELLRVLPLLLQQSLNDVVNGDGGDMMEDTLVSPQTKCGDDFFTDINGRGFFQVPCKSDEELFPALHLFELLVNNCSQRLKLLKLVDWVAKAETSSPQLRLKFVTCLQSLYREICIEATPSEGGSMDPQMKKRFLQIFIRMFDDEDESVHAVVSQFWASVLMEWNNTADLLLEIFELIGQEEHPLNVCLGLLLQRCRSAPDYDKCMFPSLEDIPFYPFQLDTSWRLRNSSFQPLFAESLSSVKNFSTLPRPLQSTLLSQRRSVGKFGMNVLRATLQNLQFTPTLERPGGHDTLSRSLMEQVEELQRMESPSLFMNDSMNLDNNIAPDAGLSSVGNNTASTPELPENSILKLRKKFYTRKDSSFYATRVTEKKEEKQEEAEEIEKSRISGVKTVRKYRIGELPDIEIKHSELLNTLLKLAKLDQDTRHQFIIYLYGGFLQEMSKDHLQSRRYLQKSKEVFERVLHNSISSTDHSLLMLLMELSVSNLIPLQMSIVLDISKITNSHRLGILKLEEELVDGCDPTNAASSSKRSKVTSCQRTKDEDMWLGLAEMYKEIEEYDVLRNLFVNACQNTGASEVHKGFYKNIGDALHLEGLGYLENALELFETTLTAMNENDENGATTSSLFLEDSIMNCMSKLGEWGRLYERTANFGPLLEDDGFLQDKNTIERLVPFRMVAGMQLALRQDNETEETAKMFNSFMEKTLLTEAGTSFLSDNYPFNVGMWLLVDDEDSFLLQTGIMIERGYENFLRRMKDMNMLPVKERKNVLSSLQQAAAINDYLKWKKQTRGQEAQQIEERTMRLLRNWRKHLAYQSPDVVGNDLIAAHRDCFASKIGIFLEEAGGTEPTLLNIQEFRVEQELWLADLGASVKNSAIAHKCLCRVKNQNLQDIKGTEFRKSMAKFLAAFSKILSNVDWNKRWCSVWKKLGIASDDPEIWTLKADLLYSLVENKTKEPNQMPQVIKTLSGGGDADATLAACILKTTEDLMNGSDLMEASQETHSALFTKLFLLLKKLSPDLLSTIPEPVLAEKMLRCVLRGCVGGSANDMLLLSNIFSLLKKFPESLTPIFSQLADIVPTYMFLPWLDQIMTASNHLPKLSPCFKPLIDRLVKEFPQAFQFQYPEYLNESCRLFAQAMKAVVLPYKLHEEKIYEVLGCRTEEEIIDRLTQYQSYLTDIINNTNKIFGEMHKEYAHEMFETVDKYVTSSQRSSGSSDSQASSREVVQKIRMDVDKTAKRLTEKAKRLSNCVNLAKLSPFLADFHFFEFAPMERPGMYENFRKPKVQEHPHIVSFHPTVQVYSSLTKPIKLTIITNDGKSSNFLAKLGDDLRQDRRIQQLFKMSNVLFQKDISINQRNLSIETYSCIPITPDFGILEMVDNVKSLTEMIFDSSSLKGKRMQIVAQYQRWLQNSSKSAPTPVGRPGSKFEPYYKSATATGRKQAEECFDELSSILPKFLLRDHIRKRTKNLQAFFSIRQNLIKSYGALCMVHWLLGIGDRHLENLLMSLTTGKIIGIDFGRAFGTSNYMISIPEMIPFRLTPQFQHLMLPYTYKGLFRESCILTWNCLVEAEEIILTVADVFIQEPSLDWLKLRKGSNSVNVEERSNGSSEMDTTTTDIVDLPFEIMKKKLQGYNPTGLLVQELKMQTTKIVPPIYCKIAENGRIHLEKEKLDSEDYVDVLLDIATDKNILIRVFEGWNAWV